MIVARDQPVAPRPRCMGPLASGTGRPARTPSSRVATINSPYMATTNGDIMLSRTDALPDNLEPQSRDDCSSDSNSSICIPRSSSPPRPARVGLPDHLNLDNKAAPAAEPPLGTMTSGPLVRKLNSKERRKEQRRKQQRKEERQRRADAADIAAALATASKRQCVRPNEGPKLHPIVLNFAGIMAKLSGVPHYPPPAGPFYTASDQLVGVLRKLIHTWDIDCALCRLHYKAPDTTTHRLENCDCLDESSDARCWLTMFKSYHASCNGKGSRCSECLFPSTLCLRTVYREDMDEEYGHEKEARENWGVIYMEAQCDWVKVIQRFVSGCMVVGGCLERCGGISVLGSAALDHMGWQDWQGLRENGPNHIQCWLQEMDEISGLRCPRLLKLFWFLAHVAACVVR